jgi:hypothetical protein
LGRHDHIVLVADRLHHAVRVLGETRRIVVAGKIGRHRAVPALAQLSFDEVPVPTNVARTVDQDERGHLEPL